MVEINKKNASEESNVAKRMLMGKVVSDKMDKTIVVSVERTYLHPRLKKVVRSSKNYKVHDEQSKAQTGDIVKIFEGRPQSKTKYMYLAEVIQSSSQQV